MAEFRNIHTRIWKDAWFSELDEDAKLLFIYLFSNERASVCGMYELPLKYIVFETGITKDRVSAIFADFEKAEKAYYRDGIVWVVNLRKYNDSGDSVKVRARADKDLDAIPDCELKRLYYAKLGIPYPQSKIPYPENNDDTEKRQKGDGEDTQTPPAADPPNPPPPPDPVNIFRMYEKEIGNITPMISDAITDAEKIYPAEWFKPAMEKAARLNKRSWAYVEAILKGWKTDGFQVDHRQSSNGHSGGRLLPDGV